MIHFGKVEVSHQINSMLDVIVHAESRAECMLACTPLYYLLNACE